MVITGKDCIQNEFDMLSPPDKFCRIHKPSSFSLMFSFFSSSSMLETYCVNVTESEDSFIWR